jgi:hypothetical protein
MGHPTWISGNDSLQVPPPPLERILGDKMQHNDDSRVLRRDLGELSKWSGLPYELRPCIHGEQRGR